MLFTVKLNDGSSTDKVPSDTAIIISEKLPTSSFVGVPDKVPVEVSKLAQLGLLVIENVRLSPTSTSLAIGIKLYAESSSIEVAGVPEMLGASLVLFTVIVNASSAVLVVPSETLIMTLAKLPTSSFVGEPDKVPVEVSKLAQLGLLLIANVRLSPTSTSLAVGVKLYAESSSTEATGLPEITGASLVFITVMLNEDNAEISEPSLTEI